MSRDISGTTFLGSSDSADRGRSIIINKGKNKIIELRKILQRESQNS
jgi:hypothetical protein